MTLAVQNLIVLLRNHQIAYATMPKAACTSVLHMLYRLDSGCDYPGDPMQIHHDPAAFVRCSKGEAADCAIRFTFVRDPAQRAYSAFRDKVMNGEGQGYEWVLRELIDEYGLTCPARSLRRHRKNFLAFLMFAAKNARGETTAPADVHFRPQSDLIDEYGIDLSHIGRVERFSEDTADIFRAAGCASPDAPRLNRSLGPGYALSQIMTDEIANMIASVYAEDYRRFGYGTLN